MATATKEYYQEKVQDYFAKYLETQREIERMERDALVAGHRNKYTQKWLLENKETEAGFAYLSLCSDRKKYMDLIQLYGMMALLS